MRNCHSRGRTCALGCYNLPSRHEIFLNNFLGKQGISLFHYTSRSNYSAMLHGGWGICTILANLWLHLRLISPFLGKWPLTSSLLGEALVKSYMIMQSQQHRDLIFSFCHHLILPEEFYFWCEKSLSVMYLTAFLDILAYQLLQKLLWKFHKHYFEAAEVCYLWCLHNWIMKGKQEKDIGILKMPMLFLATKLCHSQQVKYRTSSEHKHFMPCYTCSQTEIFNYGH